MTDHTSVNVFFYGGYMNFDLLDGYGIGKRPYHVVQLPGYQLVIGSSANVVRNGLERVFGIVTQLTPDELEILYGADAQAKLGSKYIPEAVLAYTQEGDLLPALCYIVPGSVTGIPTPAYIDTILKAASAYHFPQSYLDHIESQGRAEGE